MGERMKGEFCTSERGQHSKISPPMIRGTKAGHDAVYGVQDLEHCTLDWLEHNGYLGTAEDASDRYAVGYRLRELWFSFNYSSNDLNDLRAGFHRFEGEVENGADVAREKYNHLMRALPLKYRAPAHFICIDSTPPVGMTPAAWELMIDTLDALYGAFSKIDKNNY